MTMRLISVDSHVRISPDQIKANLASQYHSAWDDAVAEEDALHVKEMGGLDPKVLAAGFSSEAMGHPGYGEPNARIEAMDLDGVSAEILYSEVSAFRHYPLMREGWREASDAFNRVMLEFSSVDRSRLGRRTRCP